MANKKISTEEVEKFNNKIISLVAKIDSEYTSLKKYSEKIDSIASDCDIKNLQIASFYKESPSIDMENCKNGISVAFDNTLQKAQENDDKLKEKMIERSAELAQLKNIISQYKSKMGSSSPLSSVTKNLTAIGKANFIDQIPGVVEGRQKKAELDIKWHGYLSDEQLAEKIKQYYRNVNNEDLAALMKYYRIMNTPQTVRLIASEGKKVMLLNVNGRYQVVYVDLDLNYKEEVMKGKTDKSLKWENSKIGFSDKGVSTDLGTGGSASASGSMLHGEFLNGDTAIDVGNIDVSASLNDSGIGVSASGSVLKANTSITVNEDDLYRYGLDIDIEVISVGVAAKLTQDGFDIGASSGILGINVSGGRSELIDSNVNM